MQRITVESVQICDRTLTLNRDQHHYLTRVLRLREGDRFVAMDGSGRWWETELVQREDGQWQGNLLQVLDLNRELPVRVTLLAGLPKGQGFDEVVRQTTELGVSRIIPVVSDRTLLNPSPNKLQRWQRIATEAAEQSERQWVPPIQEPLSFAGAIEAVADSRAYLCVARGEVPHLQTQLRQPLSSPPPDTEEITIAIGPEGGWTPEEVQQARQAHWQPVSLGRRVLRAITAPAVAVAMIAAHYESQSL